MPSAPHPRLRNRHSLPRAVSNGAHPSDYAARELWSAIPCDSLEYRLVVPTSESPTTRKVAKPVNASAFVGTNPTGELITSGLPVRRYEPHASALPQTPVTCRLSSVPPIWQIFSLSATTSARRGLPLLEPVDIACIYGQTRGRPTLSPQSEKGVPNAHQKVPFFSPFGFREIAITLSK